MNVYSVELPQYQVFCTLLPMMTIGLCVIVLMKESKDHMEDRRELLRFWEEPFAPSNHLSTRFSSSLEQQLKFGFEVMLVEM